MMAMAAILNTITAEYPSQGSWQLPAICLGMYAIALLVLLAALRRRRRIHNCDFGVTRRWFRTPGFSAMGTRAGRGIHRAGSSDSMAGSSRLPRKSKRPDRGAALHVSFEAAAELVARRSRNSCLDTTRVDLDVPPCLVKREVQRICTRGTTVIASSARYPQSHPEPPKSLPTLLR